MEFIFKEHFLPLSQSKNTNYQYYQWVEKKRLDKERVEEEALRKKLMEIDQDDTRDKSKSKCKHKIHKNNKQNIYVKPQELYQKNILWKQGVDQKLEKLRNQMREEMVKQSEKNKQPFNKTNQQKLLRNPTHKGPFKAWNQRFQQYLRTKGQDCLAQSQNLFRPTINDKSKKLTMNLTGKVESRLIEYGERLKVKKNEMEDEQLWARKEKQNNMSISSNLSDTFFRLYKDGQKINRKKNQITPEYTFVPSINRNSILLAEKAFEKRKQINSSKVISENKDKIYEKSKSAKDKKQKEKDFSDFIKRNQALLAKIELNRSKKTEIQEQKQKIQQKMCTFIPSLNPHSLHLVANKSEPDHSKAQISSHNSGQKQFAKSSLTQNIKFPPNQDFKSSFIKMFKNSEKEESEGEQKNLIFSHLQFNTSDIQNSSINQRQVHIDRKGRYSEVEVPQTDRYTQTIINEELIEEDSIEKQKNIQWQNDLEMMEFQIQEMMKRTNA